MKGIPLPSLNPSRLQLLVGAYCAEVGAARSGQQVEPLQAVPELRLPTPQELAASDPALFLPALITDPR